MAPAILPADLRCVTSTMTRSSWMKTREAELLESIAEADRGELIPAEEILAKLRSHYDFRGGVRGKYAARYAEKPNTVVLAPDVAKRSSGEKTRVKKKSRSREAGDSHG